MSRGNRTPRRRFTPGLRWEMVAAIVLVLLVSGVIIALAIRSRARETLSASLFDRDRTVAEHIAPWLGEYYSSHGSWDGLQALTGALPGSTGNDDRVFGSATTWESLRYLITDTEGAVVFDSGLGALREEVRVVTDRPIAVPPFPELSLDSGVRIVGPDDRTEGYLFVESMVGYSMSARGREFLARLTRAVVLSIVVGTMVAIVLAGFIFARIARPIVDLARASARIARGDLDASVTVTRTDEIGMLATNFNAMAESLRAEAERRDRLIGDIAHEVRTPVTLIQGNLEMMAAGVYPIEHKRIVALLEECRLLADLLTSFDDLTKSKPVPADYATGETDLGRLIDTVLDEYTPRMRSARMTVTAEFDGLPIVAGGSMGLRRVFENLLTNAVKYAGPDATVTIASSISNGEVVVEIADDGPGVSEEHLPLLFERFYRVEPSRNRTTGGSGIGLSIARQIVEACHGTIVATPVEPHGLRFSVTLPIASRHV